MPSISISNVITMNPKSKNKNELPTPPWVELPVDVTANILQRLGVVDILGSAEKVCTTWRKICFDPSMWRVLDVQHDDFSNERILPRWRPSLNQRVLDFKPDYFSNERILPFWRRAVDRSQGQLVDLTIEHSCTVDFLNYILDRSTHLKRLTLQRCFRLTSKAVVESVNKLQHLEELSLLRTPEIQASDIITIGNACPLLNSFSFNQHGYSNYQPGFSHTYSANNSYIQETKRNEYALAIAKYMPNLCHLRLIANSINNEGLEAILNGCPNLDSLDLRQCLQLDLQGTLGKRCSEQIKHLKFPLDPVSSIEYSREPLLTYYSDSDDSDDDYDYDFVDVCNYAYYGEDN